MQITSVQVMARRERPAGLFRAPNGNGAPLGQGRTLLCGWRWPAAWGAPLVWDISAAWGEVEILL